MMPQDPASGNGNRTGIRSGALLLPAPLRYDWQHSSSQLPIHFSDARWTSSPSGRYYFRHPKAPSSTSIARHRLPAPHIPQTHGCHSGKPLPGRKGRTYIQLHRSGDEFSSLPSSPTGLAASPPPRVPIDISDTRRDLLPPAGVVFLRRTQHSCIAALIIVAEARNLVEISPKFPLDMHGEHGCHTAIALSFFAMQRIFLFIRLGRRQG